MRRRKQEWWEQSNIFDFTDKERSVNSYIKYMLLRTQSMFNYDGLPDSIPQKYLELYLQMGGHCAIAHVDGKLYALEGGFGGEPNPYYIPSQYVVANPALKISKTYTIDEDCVVVGNDALYMGLFSSMSRYATQLMENDLSMYMVSINSRIQALISAGDDRTKAAAEKYLADIAAGKLGAIQENAFLEGIKSQPYGSTANSNMITNLIEYHQYLKASWFNDLGLQANYNMKRESINSNESQLNEDMLYPLIDEMLRMRKEGIDKVNDMFGTNISVELNSSWKDNKDELELELENVASGVDSMADSGDSDDNNNEELDRTREEENEEA